MILNRLGMSLSSNNLISFLNPYSYLIIRKELNVLQSEMLFYIDGEWLCKFFNYFTNIAPTRVSFDMTSLAKKVFINEMKKGQSFYFIGSKPEEITKAVKNIKDIYPNLKIIGFRDGYISGQETKVMLEIKSLNPNIVVVGLGTPLQEKFLINLRQSGWNGIGYTCGGFFHQTAKSINYYPVWMNKLNLRWVYRIYDEPKLFWRYLIHYPKFILFFFYDLALNRWWIGKIIES